ncbi:MAG: hypothetical protein Q9208_003450 [Pyrenodesmia sp. 3 TL-2023]
MEPDPANSPRIKPAHGISQQPPRSARKRSRRESSSEASIAENVKPRLGTPGRLDGEDSTNVASSNDLATSYHSRTATWLGGTTDQSAGDYPDDVNLSSNRGVEDRRKFQRQEAIQSSDPATSDELADQLPSTDEGSPHDPMAVALGVGWRTIRMNDPLMQASTRASVKYIEKFYGLNDVVIVAEHPNELKLARTSNGIWIFGDETKCGALLADSWMNCIKELRSRGEFIWRGLQLRLPAISDASNGLVQSATEEHPIKDTVPMEDRIRQGEDFRLYSSPSGDPEASGSSDSGHWYPDNLFPTIKRPSPLQDEASADASDGGRMEVDLDDEMGMN